ncbi:MAG: hypothetical protein GF308_07355 [Candidatus Heimdallarchaeota archaeon]|nr:hypothetical protein [Candidatus Heimdallarchaeota archaeon]
MTLLCPFCQQPLTADDLCWLPEEPRPKREEEQIAYYYCCHCRKIVPVNCAEEHPRPLPS